MVTQYGKHTGMQNMNENFIGQGKPTIYKSDWERQGVPTARQVLIVTFPDDHDLSSPEQHSGPSPNPE